MSKILKELNEKQREAVLHGDGPLLVLAGAGSGKTRVITYRVGHLVGERKAPPESVLAVTFTNKAAGEMRQRVVKLLDGGETPYIGTFHSFCLRLLRRYGGRVGLAPGFVVYDQGDQLDVIKESLAALDVPEDLYTPRRALSLISAAKSRLVGPDEFASRNLNFPRDQLARIYVEYQNRLRKNQASDFDDLLFYTVQLLEDDERTRESLSRQYQHILIDEYQDTNHAQYRIARALAGKKRNVCAVGDEDQSIYRWRGAEVSNILDFEKAFPNARVIRLEQNYRSTATILAAASAVVANNRGRLGKTLWTEGEKGDPIVLYQADDETDEAGYVTKRISELGALGTMAVLVRTNAQFRTFEEHFIGEGIGYTTIGGIRFFERKEVKDLLAYLRVVLNPSDSTSLRRILNVPPRGIGRATLRLLEERIGEEHVHLLDSCRSMLGEPTLQGRSRFGLQALLELIDGAAKRTEDMGPEDFLRMLLDESGYLEYIDRKDPDAAEAASENVREFLSATNEYEHKHPDAKVADFLDHVSLLARADAGSAGSRVLLMTLHCAKGLEFPVVFMAGMEEGLLPHSESSNENEELEEERRLCHVGMTRAEKRLILTFARSRALHGRRQYRDPSRFLGEIPEEILQGVEAPKPVEKVEPEPVSERPRRFRAEGQSSSLAAIQYFFKRQGTEVDVESLQDALEEDDLPPDEFFEQGDAIIHPTFGPGTVLSVQKDGPRTKAVVYFDRHGRKTLVTEYAKLRKIRRR